MDVSNEDALPVVAVNEVFKMPVVNEKDVKVVGQFLILMQQRKNSKRSCILR
ncbi:hypothetical protein KHA80_11475 [Anaerobacillus sp. HL2]|nr:hypothetical protein KHA80_11475 [Anaerobacillus sp. HL2]